MIFILGGNGYVGSAYVRLCEARGFDHKVITRDNYDELAGQACDVFINANGNSKKFMADRDPKWEFDASVRSVMYSLVDFPSEAYIHLSTGDVYPDQSAPEFSREDQEIDPKAQSRYGLHKHMAEHAVRALREKHIVMRMGGFVGPGMKKNAIFDMLNDAPVWLKPDSDLQFISTDTAARLVWKLYENAAFGETVNLGAKGKVNIGELHERIGSESEFQSEARSIQFEISTDKLARLTGEDLPQTRGEVENFLTSMGR